MPTSTPLGCFKAHAVIDPPIMKLEKGELELGHDGIFVITHIANEGCSFSIMLAYSTPFRTVIP